MITYISTANDTNYTHYAELLLATKIVHSKDNEIARKHHRDQIISTQYYQYTKFWFRMPVHHVFFHLIMF